MNPTTIALIVAVVLLGGVLLFFALAGALYVTRGNPVEGVRVLGDGEASPDVSNELFCRQIESHVNTDLAAGNEVEVLFDGDGVYPRLFEDLANAEDLITWHVFWHKPGELSDRIHQTLQEQARKGVTVLLLYDHFGAKGIPGEYWDSLREAGCEVHPYRPFRWNDIYKWQQRSHMRSVVIDGRVGYTGGFGIDDPWLGDGRHEDQWRDTSVRVQGPAVPQLQAAFASDWAEATGDLLVGERLFRPECLDHDGPHVAGLLYGAPSLGSTDIERFWALSISGAHETLYLTNAYFVPDDDFRRLLVQAAERGVDVRVLNPGRNTDKPSTWYAARAHYAELLEAGIRIWEYRPTMVHAKTFAIDGIWSAVGSVNFDNRSMSLNEEVVLMVHARDIAARLTDRFLEDLEHADEVSLEAIRERGPWEHAKERFWLLFSRFL